MTVYIVSGFVRSGTSMMMESLKAGGMEVAFNPKREAYAQKFGSIAYKPNDAYFELEADDLYTSEFPSPYEGKLIKVLWNSMIRLPPHTDYRVIFMRRPKEEIEASCAASFGNAPLDVLNDAFDCMMERIVSVIGDRRSVTSLDEIWYGDVLEDPLDTFCCLGWPINPLAAAAIPTFDKYRHRRAA